MSAVKVIFKRSSLLGKRPSGANLEAGEIGLNTNSNDPGLFLEVNDGSVVKVGPTAYLPSQPTATPALGELWVDSDTKALSIGKENQKWQTVAAPFLGGTGGYTVFVAPEYPNASDSLANDGQTVPFLTINRAILEVTKQIILQANSGISSGNNRYLIVLAPGRHCVVNGPGTTVNNFTVNFASSYILAGTFNAGSGIITTITTEGAAGGLTVGSQLPTPSSANNNYVFIASQAGSYTPPGGGGPYAVQIGDQFVSNGSAWVYEGPEYRVSPSVSQPQLQQFNPVSGGLILPRGVSIIGLDLKKCEIHPVYVPKYTHPNFPPNYQQDTNNGPIYQNEPVSNVFKWSGNTYVSQFTCQDKILSRSVVSIKASSSGLAVFKTDRPHGLNYNDFTQVNYTNSADQGNATFVSGAYYVNPLNPYEFELSAGTWESTASSPVLFSTLPVSFTALNASEAPKFNVLNIYPYYIPLNGNSYEFSNYSHHRLSVLGNASISDLNTFYTKVQIAFPTQFGGQVNTTVVSLPEYEIVAPAEGIYPNNVTSNSVDNSSPYQNMVNHRSNYGMANGDYDANVVTGFKSVIINSATAVVLQKDPAAYEVYANTPQEWQTLTTAVQQQLPSGTPITSVPTGLQLQELNDTSLPNIRYYYQNLLLDNGKSTGIPDPDNDFRHFGFRVAGSNAFMQAQSTYTIGAAIGCWAKEGAIISLTNATTNFGSVAFQSEGFAGIGTLGGANPINKGFLQSGITRPLTLTDPQVTSDSQKKILSLGSKVVYVGPDPSSPGVQLIYLQGPFDPATILPYSLKPDSAVYVTDSICTYRAFFVTNGEPTCILAESDPIKNPYSQGGAILRVRLSDSSIPNGSASQVCLDIPYIRRYIDPRQPSQKSYGFYIQSTNPTSQAPQLGSVLRLNQTGQNLSTTLKRNYQFDPGQFGGISQVFTVDLVESLQFNQSNNFNNKISDTAQSTVYSVYASLTDASSPWLQSVPDADGNMVPYNSPTGTYFTYNNRNYYASENNLWSSLYYQTTYNQLNGPTKVAPDKFDSVFVTTSVLEKQEPVADSWQGYVEDPYYNYYTSNLVPDDFKSTLTYMRGAVTPYQMFPISECIDLDDSTSSLGIIFTREPAPISTVTTTVSSVAQTPVAMTSPFVASPSFGRPELITLDLLQVSQIPNPRNELSILQLSNISVGAVEYVRVVNLTSNIATVIRNYYPTYSSGTLPAVWPAGTTVKVCLSTCYPEPSVYDPNWSVTKATVLRYYNLMGYKSEDILPYLTPKYAGERILLNTDLPLSPFKGYANTTAAWPIEFNNPSTILANTHTWQYVGYFDYSRGLPKYQVNEISRKLQFDYYSTATWGGRLTVLGADQSGSIVFLGPIREALTGNFYAYNTAPQNFADKVVTPTITPIDYPNPILVYSADDISGNFDGSAQVFDLTKGGFSIPNSQLSTNGVFVFLGGVVQQPNVAYFIQGSSTGSPTPQIVFTEAPLEGTSCDIRIVSSDDESETMQVTPFALSPSFDGVQSTFTLTPSEPTITDLNSFVFLGGVEQNPAGLTQTSAAYTITHSSGISTLTFIGGAPLSNTVLDIRGILSGPRYRGAGVSTVFVSSVDDIAPLFNGTRVSFPLTIGGEALDPTKVNSQNMFVSLGGVMQIPIAQTKDVLAGLAYTVAINSVSNALEITFAAPPSTNTTCNIRVITSDEFLTCPLPLGLLSTTLQDGPGIIVNDKNQIIEIDSGLINP